MSNGTNSEIVDYQQLNLLLLQAGWQLVELVFFAEQTWLSRDPRRPEQTCTANLEAATEAVLQTLARINATCLSALESLSNWGGGTSARVESFSEVFRESVVEREPVAVCPEDAAPSATSTMGPCTYDHVDSIHCRLRALPQDGENQGFHEHWREVSTALISASAFSGMQYRELVEQIILAPSQLPQPQALLLRLGILTAYGCYPVLTCCPIAQPILAGPGAFHEGLVNLFDLCLLELSRWYVPLHVEPPRPHPNWCDPQYERVYRDTLTIISNLTPRLEPLEPAVYFGLILDDSEQTVRRADDPSRVSRRLPDIQWKILRSLVRPRESRAVGYEELCRHLPESSKYVDEESAERRRLANQIFELRTVLQPLGYDVGNQQNHGYFLQEPESYPEQRSDGR